MKPNKPAVLIIFVVLLMCIAAFFVLKPDGKQSDFPPKPAGVHNPVQRGRVLVYFNKNKGAEIVTEPVVRSLPALSGLPPEERVAYAMNELLKGPTDTEEEQGYFSEIPKETRLLSVSRKKRGVEVDLSADFTAGGGANSMTQRLYQVTRTVASVPQRVPVYLKVAGQDLNTLGGEGVMVKEPITDDPSVAQ